MLLCLPWVYKRLLSYSLDAMKPFLRALLSFTLVSLLFIWVISVTAHVVYNELPGASLNQIQYLTDLVLNIIKWFLFISIPTLLILSITFPFRHLQIAMQSVFTEHSLAEEEIKIISKVFSTSGICVLAFGKLVFLTHMFWVLQDLRPETIGYFIGNGVQAIYSALVTGLALQIMKTRSSSNLKTLQIINE
jgi:hypothetical protein